MPGESYFKMIDVWLLLTISIPFLEVILHTIQQHQRLKHGIKVWETRNKEETNIAKLKTVENFAKIWLPTIFVGFVLGFLLTGCLILFHQ